MRTEDDPFADDQDVGRSSRDSHTVRLAYVRPHPERQVPPPVVWAVRLGIAIALAALLGWFALPEPPVQRHPGRIPVRLWHQWTGERQPLIDRVVSAFNTSQERYEVIALAIPGQTSEQKFLLGVAGGDPPDVMTQYHPTISTWAADGLLQPLDPLLGEEDHRVLREDAHPIAIAAGTHEGRLYGIAIGLNTFACYYRPDLLRVAGLDPDRFPTTLEELMEWGRRLDRSDSAGRLQRIGFLPARLPLFAPLFGGGFSVRPDGGITIDTPANRRALEFITEAYRRYGFERLVHFRSSLNSGGLAVEWPFVSGQYPIVIEGQWRVEQLATYAPEIEYRTAPLPPPAGGKPGGGFATANLAVIPVGARQPAGAMTFIRFWSGLERPERAAAFNTSGGWLPLRRATVRSPDYQDFIARNPQFSTFVDQLDSIHLEPLAPVAYQVFFQNRVSACEDHAVRGSKTPAQALADLEAEIERERARRARLMPRRVQAAP